MFTPIRTLLIAIALSGALTLVGCSKKEEDPATASVLTAQDSILKYVPADTPYLVASIEPLPDSLLDKLEPQLDEVLRAYEVVLREAMKMARSEAAADGGDPEDLARFNAVIDELSSLMSVEGLRGAGFSRESTGAVYGVGLLPVIRLTVSDGALFDAALSRIETEAGQKMDVATIDNQAYRYVAADEVKVLIATFADQVVVSVVPSTFDDGQTSQVLGLTPPETNIAQSGALADIAREYQYTNQYIGFVDIERIVGAFVGDTNAINTALLDLMSHDRPELTDVCKAEIRAIAGVAPRLVMGYKTITDDQLETQAVIELRNDIAAGLAGLPAAVPGLSGDKGGLMSFGMSMDVMAARNFYEARLDALEAEPFECEHFADMQAGIAAGRLALNQPVPPMIYDFKGFLAVINDVEGLDLATNTPPTSMDGRMLLAMDNAPALLALGAMFSPEVAGLNIEPDGKPVAFDLPQMQSVVDSVYIALTDDALAMSFGDGMELELDAMLSADADNNGTFMSFSMDASRYYAFIADAMSLAEQDEENPMPPEMQAAMNDIMVAFSGFYDRVTADVRFTERGVEIDSLITLKD